MADIIESTFDDGFDGWRSKPGKVFQQSEGGDPGGYIDVEAHGRFTLMAPSTYLGSKTAYLHGTLTLEEFGSTAKPYVIISNGGLAIAGYAKLVGPGSNGFYHYSIEIDGRGMDPYVGNDSTNHIFRDVMSHITSLTISDHTDGFASEFDNIDLVPASRPDDNRLSNFKPSSLNQIHHHSAADTFHHADALDHAHLAIA